MQLQRCHYTPPHPPQPHVLRSIRHVCNFNDVITPHPTHPPNPTHVTGVKQNAFIAPFTVGELRSETRRYVRLEPKTKAKSKIKPCNLAQPLLFPPLMTGCRPLDTVGGWCPPTKITEVLGVAFWKSWLNYIDMAVSIISVAPWRSAGSVAVSQLFCVPFSSVSYEGRNSQRLANHESFQVWII